MEYVTMGIAALTLILVIAMYAVLSEKMNRLEQNSRGRLTKNDLDELEDDIERSIENAVNLTAQKIDSAEKIILQLQERQSNASESQMNMLRQSVTDTLQGQGNGTAKSIEQLQNGIHAQLLQMQQAIGSLQSVVQEQIAELRNGVNSGMEKIRTVNQEQLTEIKKTVDEQLQDALDKKLKQSFDSVVEQLSIVQKGLGEMQALAVGVGDLKKVLSNTKTRGILGEAQLGAILEQILSPEQYETNVCTVKGSKEPVEYAVKLPGTGDEAVYLPIDSKFPLETYSQLVDAYDSADAAAIESARKNLEMRLLGEAKDIHTKYVHVPETTEFGVLFLPVEGLYAEAVRLGMVEKLQNRYRINIAGPTTMAAFLNSLQMGFRTLAIQKRSAEVWNVLGNVKTEFGKFEEVLEKTQQRLTQAGDELEKLVGVRTRRINKSLSDITENADLLTDIQITDNNTTEQ